MCTRILRTLTGSGALLLVLLALPVQAQGADAKPVEQPVQLETPSTPAESDSTATALAAPGSADDAEQAFQRGVALYKKDQYREALTEFNRAIALNPGLAEAKAFAERCNAKLNLAAGGTDPAAVPTFETFDAENIDAQQGAQQTAEELKKQRVKELLDLAVRYEEAQKWDTALEIYEEVRLQDPRNTTAEEGIHRATLGKSKKESDRARQTVTEQHEQTRGFIEDKKQWPDGAGPDGIKKYRFAVPEIEEKFEEVAPKTVIEETLDSPVSVEFEDIHINDVIAFIIDTYSINIVLDSRAVEPPAKPTPAGAPGAPGVPGAPGAFPGAPGAFPGAAPGAFPQAQPSGGGRDRERRGTGLAQFAQANNAGPANRRPGQPGGQQSSTVSLSEVYGTKSSGRIPYINMKNVPLRVALAAMLRPLNLDFVVQPDFLWITKPEIIERESFERVETRYYELRNAGSETLFKIVLRNPFGGNRNGNQQGGGGFGGGNRGGQQGGFGGGSSGGGFGGGSSGGGFGGGSQGGGGFGGGSSGGGFGGGSQGGGGFGGGSQGGFGGGSQGGNRGGGQGGFGGGQGGNQNNSDVTSLSNISDLFTSINDAIVGETPATQFVVGLNNGGTGTGRGGRNGGGAGGGINGAQGGAGLGRGTTGSSFTEDAPILQLLERVIPEVYMPGTNELLSDMIYNPSSNQLIVKNTPSNLKHFEKQLAEIDVTPKQVSIEAKFLTIRTNDLDKVGFKWDLSLSDQNNRDREVEALTGETYDYDINGDGVDEPVPFYNRPDGSNVIRNTISEGTAVGTTLLGAPAQSTFNLATSILNNADGDKIGVTLDFLDSLQDSELLSAPRVTTLNRKPAVIADFTTEYFVSAVLTDVFVNDGGFGGSGTQTVATQVIPQPFNFGITLSVTPQIRDDDQVRLWLNPEVRTRVGEKNFSQKTVSGDNEIENTLTLPTTNIQSVWTNVIVHDGDTLVLGGLVTDQSTKGEDRLPYLGKIPVLGFFFRGKFKETKQSSLLIFVTPDIVDSTGARFFDTASK